MDAKRLTVFVVIVMLLISLGLFASTLVRHAPPWKPTGTLVIVLGPAFDHAELWVAAIGLDDLVLERAVGRPVRATLRTRRVSLEQQAGLTLVLEVPIPTGSYTGLSFRLRDPAATPPAPGAVSLPHDLVRVPVSFEARAGAVTALLVRLERTLIDEDGTYLYRPVMHVEARSGAVVEHDANGWVLLRGGTITENSLYGMSEDGSMRQNYRPNQYLGETHETEPLPPADTLETERAEEEVSTEDGFDEDMLDETEALLDPEPSETATSS